MENHHFWILQRVHNTDVTPIVIKEGLYKIGRSPESNILCKSEWVSRFHCDITVRDGLVFIRDLGSLNGTFIEEQEILKKRDTELKHGDIISLGKAYAGGLPEADHYVYKLVGCTEPQEAKTRKRKASTSPPHKVSENADIQSPKRRRTTSVEKCREDDASQEIQASVGQPLTDQGLVKRDVAQPLLSGPAQNLPTSSTNGTSLMVNRIMTNICMEFIDLTDDNEIDCKPKLPITAETSIVGTEPATGSTSPDSSNKEQFPADINYKAGTRVRSATKGEMALRRLINDAIPDTSKREEIFKSIGMFSGDEDEEKVQPRRSMDIECSTNSPSKVPNGSEIVKDRDYISDRVSSSNISVNAMEESTSFQLDNYVNSSMKQTTDHKFSENEMRANASLVLQSAPCDDSQGRLMIRSPKIEERRNVNHSFNKSDCSIQTPNNQSLCSKVLMSTSPPEVISTSSTSISPKVVTEKPNDKETIYTPQVKKVRSGSEASGSFNEELKELENVLERCSDNHSSLLSKEKDKRDVSVCTEADIAITEKANIVDKDTHIDNSLELLTHQKDSNILINVKQELFSQDELEEEMVFSQQVVDGVVVIDSDDELEFSQLFMEQDGAEKEITNEKRISIKEEFIYDVDDDNEDIDLFQSHFSQCSQEQELTKAEISSKLRSRSVSTEDEILSKERPKKKKSKNNELRKKHNIQDVRVKLNRLNIEPFTMKVDLNLEKVIDKPVSDEASCASKHVEAVKGLESKIDSSVSFEHQEQSINDDVIDLDKLEIIKPTEDHTMNFKSYILKRNEPSNEPVDNILSKIQEVSTVESELRKLFDSDQTEHIESNKESIDLKGKRSVKSNKLSDASKTKKPSLNNDFVKLSDRSEGNKVSTSSKMRKHDHAKESANDCHKKKVESGKKTSGSSHTIRVESKRHSVDSSEIKKTESSKVDSNQMKGVDSKKDSPDYSHNKKNGADKEAEIKLPPPDSLSGAKLVKSTLLSVPPGAKTRKKRGRPKKDETSFTKEYLKRHNQKQIVEDRKAKLKSIALQGKLDKHTKPEDDTKSNTQNKDSSPIVTNTKDKTIDTKESDKDEKPNEIKSLNDTLTTKLAISRVAKITERSRGSILLEGFLDGPSSRKTRARKKIVQTNSSSNDMVVSDKCKETTVIKEQTPLVQLPQSGNKKKSCLRMIGKPPSGHKVTFNLNLQVRIFECDGERKPVNTMALKDKAAPPSPVKIPSGSVQNTVITTLNETFFDIVHWNASWINELKVVQGEPPVYGEKYNVKDSYVSYKDYKRWLYPLMMYELWGNMCNTMDDEDVHKTGRAFDGIILQFGQYGAHSTNGKNLLLLKCFFPLYGKQAQNIVDPMDILLIKALCARSGKRTFFVMFGLVYSSVKLTSHWETSDPIAKHFLTTLNKQPDVCAYFDIIIYESTQKQVATGFQLRIRSAYNMMNELRQFESLMKLASSPLLPIIIDPVRHSTVYLRKDLNNKIVTQYPLNDEQRNAILCSTQSVFANKPSISLIHGPPGTGKTQVIVSIVEQLLYTFKMKSNCKRKKILICSQSNAAIDEICLRLLDVRKELPREKRFKLTRFGRTEKIHHKVVEIQTTTLARKEVEKRNLFEEFSLELSLHKASERMLANALEKSSSPKKLGHYQKKYECVQKSIASLEGFVNKTFSNETRTKQIEKVIFDEEMKVIYHSDIIATTLGSCSQRKLMKAFNDYARHGEADRREFGVCIIDEATQTTEADVILPLVYDVKNFILVGDPQQLSPFVVSQTAKKCGLGQSLFSRLYKVWSGIPSAPVYHLMTQHRMHPEIAHYPSKTFYDGKLITPSFLAIKRPFKPYSVITHMYSQDSGETNKREASMVVEIMERLLSDPDMKGLSVGLIVPYQRQRSLMLDLIQEKKPMKMLSVHTIDGCQGQERDVILLSCVRTSGVGFLNDNQRINVALTRAKKALYIIANFSSLQSSNVWKNLLEDAGARNLHMDLGPSSRLDNILEFLLERNNKKSRTSSS